MDHKENLILTSMRQVLLTLKIKQQIYCIYLVCIAYLQIKLVMVNLSSSKKNLLKLI